MRKNGFTLVELMTVVAIIGILAAIAIPVYQDYLARTKVSEGIVLSLGLKKAIVETFFNVGPSDMTCNSVATCENIGMYFQGVAAMAGNKNVSEITSGRTGTITIVYKPNVVPVGANTLLIEPVSTVGVALDLSANSNAGSQVFWACGMGPNPSTVAIKYLPVSCR